MFNLFVLLFTMSSISAQTMQPSDPIVVADNDGNLDAVQALSTHLLDDARQRKSTGKAGYGAQYRRAAWAAFDESSTGDASVSVTILQELIAAPETTFDTYDAYRMLGQMHARPGSWAQARDYYETAKLITEAEPILVDRHPKVFVSVCQGLAIANTASQNYEDSLAASIALRDHSSDSISHNVRRNAAYAALETARKLNDLSIYTSAWDTLESRFPERLSGRKGVVSRYIHALTLAELSDQNERVLLEELWGQQNIRNHDHCIIVGVTLADSWVTGEESQQNADFAFIVLKEIWTAISTNETIWISHAQGNQSRIDSLNGKIKSVLVRLIETAIGLNEHNEAMGFINEFITRYGDSDSRGESWLEQLSNQTP